MFDGPTKGCLNVRWQQAYRHVVGELFVISTRALGVLPPIWTGVRWALFGEDDVATVCNIEFLPLFRIWQRAVLVIGVRDLFADRLVTRCRSCVDLGLAFMPSGIRSF